MIQQRLDNKSAQFRDAFVENDKKIFREAGALPAAKG